MCCCQCCSDRDRKIWVSMLCAVLFSLSITALAIWPYLSAWITHQHLVLKEGSEAYASWVQAPIPIYMELTMFNWTNPEEVRNPLVKPHFVEMGPYVFLEKHLKQNITFHNNGTVSYLQKRSWFFDKQRSNGTLQDMLTAAHVITATVADMMRHRNKFIKESLNFVLNHKGGRLYVTRTVGEWIFDGYKDKLIDFLKIFNTTKFVMPYDRFGWMVDRNGSAEYDGYFTINTGVENITSLGALTHWNGRTETGFYKAPCGSINGTVGDIFPPNIDPHSQLTIFATDACRYLNLLPNGTAKRFGITANEWVGTTETLDSGENYAQQQCFCDPTYNKCPKTGVVDCKKCRQNAPIYVSFPHFYLADESYLNAVSGLHPHPDKHKFTLAVEPNTGIPLEVNARLQINMMIQPDEDFDIYRGVQSFLMPMFWLDQKATLDEKLADRTKIVLLLPYCGYIVAGLLLVMTCVFYYAFVIAHCCSFREDDDEDQLITDDLESD